MVQVAGLAIEQCWIVMIITRVPKIGVDWNWRTLSGVKDLIRREEDCPWVGEANSGALGRARRRQEWAQAAMRRREAGRQAVGL